MTIRVHTKNLRPGDFCRTPEFRDMWMIIATIENTGHYTRFLVLIDTGQLVDWLGRNDDEVFRL